MSYKYKYLVPTMGHPDFARLVIKEFEKRKYTPYSSPERREKYFADYTITAILIDEDNMIILCWTTNLTIYGDVKKLTLADLMKLPSLQIDDEEEELAEHIYQAIGAYHFVEKGDRIWREWVSEQNWCKVKQKVEEKLGI